MSNITWKIRLNCCYRDIKVGDGGVGDLICILPHFQLKMGFIEVEIHTIIKKRFTKTESDFLFVLVVAVRLCGNFKDKLTWIANINEGHFISIMIVVIYDEAIDFFPPE